MDRPAEGPGARKVAAATLLAASLLHLPLVYLLIERARGEPTGALVPIMALSMGAAWASGALIDRRGLTIPYAASGLLVLKLPAALVAGGDAGLRDPPFLAMEAGISALGAVALLALLASRKAPARRAAGSAD